MKTIDTNTLNTIFGGVAGISAGGPTGPSNPLGGGSGTVVGGGTIGGGFTARVS